MALINQSKAFLLVREITCKEAARHGIDGSLIKAIAATESGFNPRVVSPAGAVGIMQIMPDTARLLGCATIPGRRLRTNSPIRPPTSNWASDT